MTSRVYTSQHLVPVGTLQAAPQIQTVTLDDLVLETVQVIIPDGHNGFTGIAITSQRLPVVPFAPGTFLVGNGEQPVFPYGRQVGANQLTVTTFNTDIYPHTFYLRWTLTEDTPAVSAVIVSPQAGNGATPGDLAAVLALTGGG